MKPADKETPFRCANFVHWLDGERGLICPGCSAPVAGYAAVVREIATPPPVALDGGHGADIDGRVRALLEFIADAREQHPGTHEHAAAERAARNAEMELRATLSRPPVLDVATASGRDLDAAIGAGCRRKPDGTLCTDEEVRAMFAEGTRAIATGEPFTIGPVTFWQAPSLDGKMRGLVEALLTIDPGVGGDHGIAAHNAAVDQLRALSPVAGSAPAPIATIRYEVTPAEVVDGEVRIALRFAAAGVKPGDVLHIGVAGCVAGSAPPDAPADDADLRAIFAAAPRVLPGEREVVRAIVTENRALKLRLAALTVDPTPHIYGEAAPATTASAAPISIAGCSQCGRADVPVRVRDCGHGLTLPACDGCVTASAPPDAPDSPIVLASEAERSMAESALRRWEEIATRRRGQLAEADRNVAAMRAALGIAAPPGAGEVARLRDQIAHATEFVVDGVFIGGDPGAWHVTKPTDDGWRRLGRDGKWGAREHIFKTLDEAFAAVRALAMSAPAGKEGGKGE